MMLHVCDELANVYSVKFVAGIQFVCVFRESLYLKLHMYSSADKTCPGASSI